MSISYSITVNNGYLKLPGAILQKGDEKEGIKIDLFRESKTRRCYLSGIEETSTQEAVEDRVAKNQIVPPR
jgi:hypothetical protein